MERQPALPLIAEPAGQNQAPELRAASAIPLVPGRSAPPPVEARPCATSGLGPFHVSAIVATQQRALRPSSTAIGGALGAGKRNGSRRFAGAGRRESNPRVQLGISLYPLKTLIFFDFWHLFGMTVAMWS